MKYIDPFNVVNQINNDICYKESFLLFTVVVAGKKAKIISEKINALLNEIMKNQRGLVFKTIEQNYGHNNYEPFLTILKQYKTGKYTTIVHFVQDFNYYNIDLNHCSVEELEKLRGIGKKSSRFFMLYNNMAHKQYAVLDTHVLNFMTRFESNIPKSTPSGKKYDELEQKYLTIYNNSGFKGTLQEFDYAIWETKGQIELPNKDSSIIDKINNQ